MKTKFFIFLFFLLSVSAKTQLANNSQGFLTNYSEGNTFEFNYYGFAFLNEGSLSFKSERIDNNYVILKWSALSAKNIEGFYIERMLDVEGVYEVIAYVKAKKSEDTKIAYQLFDENTYSGNSFYRLRTVPFVAEENYTEMNSVSGNTSLNSSFKIAEIYPNPVHDELKISFDELPEGVSEAQIQVLALDGRVIHQYNTPVNSYQLQNIQSVKQLVPAIYMLKIIMNNGKQLIKQFVKR
jgi:hypothetical protein